MCCNWHVSPHKLADREGVAALALDPGGTIAINYGQVQLSAVFPVPTLSLPSDVSLSLFLICFFCAEKSLFSLGNKDAEQQRADSGDRIEREREQSGEQESEKATSSEMPSRDRADRPRRLRSANIVISGADASMRNPARNSLEGDFCKATGFSILVTSGGGSEPNKKLTQKYSAQVCQCQS